MNMIVNHQITLSEENKISTGKGSANTGNNIDDIISDLSDIIFQMNILFKKNRDILNAYSQKQQMLGWDIQISSIQNKRDAIDKTATGTIASGVCSILAGVTSGLGAVASLKLGDIAIHGSSALGQLGVGSGKLAEGQMALQADLQRMTSDLQSSGAQSYNKNISELSDKISELSDKISELRQNMKDLGNNINNMMGQISMAVKL
ncbi:chemotaxis protein [Yersinia enterocolitica]|uniref:chemotaxis protein n=1 Tax=Yersinia enterocolitica TaxID=630 RepID=UPI002A123FC7|nr:chemotaxis protein [Yersinia enterocolitica]EKN6283598.1 chemotaxis protein [Yersinia enterocolitica]ELY5204559.1 chemotaxis protein [Yersinia enterocolitica]ELY5241480.1 chemotaxis protein [Yersinia enterocolitica]